MRIDLKQVRSINHLNYESEWFEFDTRIPANIFEESSYTFSLILVDYNEYRWNYTFDIDDIRGLIFTSENTVTTENIVTTDEATNRSKITKLSPFLTINGFEWNIFFVLLTTIAVKKLITISKNRKQCDMPLF